MRMQRCGRAGRDQRIKNADRVVLEEELVVLRDSLYGIQFGRLCVVVRH
jgi:hypothetical protein